MTYSYVPSNKDWFRNSKVNGGGGGFTDTQTHRHHGYRVSVLSFFQNKENGLKNLTQPL
jgi:hypothetical protein